MISLFSQLQSLGKRCLFAFASWVSFNPLCLWRRASWVNQDKLFNSLLRRAECSFSDGKLLFALTWLFKCLYIKRLLCFCHKTHKNCFLICICLEPLFALVVLPLLLLFSFCEEESINIDESCSLVNSLPNLGGHNLFVSWCQHIMKIEKLKYLEGENKKQKNQQRSS